MKVLIAALIVVASFRAAYAHGDGGRLARDGCHYDRKLKIRHCH